MRKISLVLLLAMLTAALAACGAPGVGGSDSGTPQAPSNAVKINIAYSPEKEGWLKDRIAAFKNKTVKQK